MSYEALIIGGGISGLTAAIILAKKKKKVIILEQHNVVGGHASGFTRKGYFFDSGVISVGVPFIQGFMEELDLIAEVNFKQYSSSFSFKDFNFSPRTVKEFFEDISDLFVREKNQILAFYKHIEEGINVYSAISKIPNPFSYKGLKKIRKFMDYGKIMPKNCMKVMKELKKYKAVDVLKKYLDENGEAYDFFSNWGYKGVDLFYFIAEWVSLIEMENYPYNGFQGLANKLKEKYLSFGGELLTSVKVKKIIIENDKAVGVELIKKANIKKLYGKNIITAMDLKKVFLNLIGDEYIDEVFLDKIKNQEMSETYIPLYLGLNVSRIKIRKYFNGAKHLYYSQYMIKNSSRLNDKNYFKNIGLGLFSSCLINPGHAPENKSNILILMPSPPKGWNNNWGIKNGNKTEEYEKIKKMITKQVLDVLEKLIPEIKNRSKIEVCELGTPFTIEKYTGNTDGSSCGFTWDKEKTFVKGTLPGKYFDYYDKIKSLYFIGHQTVYGGGMPNAFLTGKTIAEKLNRKLF